MRWWRGSPLLSLIHGRRREVSCCAASFEQSRIIFEDVLGYLRGAGFDLDDRAVWRKQDSANRAWLEHRASGARVRCIGSDPKTAHGLRPFFVLADEPAQWEPATRDRMLAALETGLGKFLTAGWSRWGRGRRARGTGSRGCWRVAPDSRCRMLPPPMTLRFVWRRGGRRTLPSIISPLSAGRSWTRRRRRGGTRRYWRRSMRSG